MNFDPQKFFIGLMDFFSILLPDALFTWLLIGEVGSAVLGDRYVNLDGAQAWAAFLFASYLFGHHVGRVAGPEEKIAGEGAALTFEYMNRHDLSLAGKGGHQ